MPNSDFGEQFKAASLISLLAFISIYYLSGGLSFKYNLTGEAQSIDASGEPISGEMPLAASPNALEVASLEPTPDATEQPRPLLEETAIAAQNDLSTFAKKSTANFYAGSKRIAQKDNSALAFVHGDNLDNSIVLTNGAGNEKAGSRISYDAFGAPSIINGASFTGIHKLDPGTGLYYLGARFYDTTSGRFISADSEMGEIANPSTLNRYAYALSNPLKFIDPDGRRAKKGGGFIVYNPTGRDMKTNGGFFKRQKPMLNSFAMDLIVNRFNGKGSRTFFGDIDTGSAKRIVMRAKELYEAQGPIDLFILTAHGQPGMIGLNPEDARGNPNPEGIIGLDPNADIATLSELRNYLSDDAVCILQVCEASVPDTSEGMPSTAQIFADALQEPVYAADFNLNILLYLNGKIVGVDSDNPIYKKLNADTVLANIALNAGLNVDSLVTKELELVKPSK